MNLHNCYFFDVCKLWFFSPFVGIEMGCSWLCGFLLHRLNILWLWLRLIISFSVIFFPGSLCLCLGLSFHSLNEIKSNSLQTNRILFEVASNFFRPYLFADGRCITPQRIHCLNVSLPLEQ